MDRLFQEALAQGVEALSLSVTSTHRERLERYADRLLAWNRKVNLTAITAPAELAEKHLVDSLVLLPFLEGARTLLDVGSGAGLPGIPLACVRSDLSVTCCDSVAKKVAFVKAVSAELDLDVRGVVARAEGHPEQERLPLADAVVSRALADPDLWVPLAVHYVAPGGTLFAMLGRDVDRTRLESLGAAQDLELVGLDQFELPISRAARAVVRWRRR